MVHFQNTRLSKIAALTACALLVLATVGGVIALVLPHHGTAAASGSPGAAAGPTGAVASRPALAAPRYDPPQGFQDGSGTRVGSSDAVVEGGLAYSFHGSDTNGGSTNGDSGPTVHATALDTGADQWEHPLPELSFPLNGHALPPLAVAATPDGHRWVYYAATVLIQGTGTQVDQLKLEVGALDSQTGTSGWVTQVSLPQAYLQTAESVSGDVGAGLMGADRDHLVVRVSSSDDAPITYTFSAQTHALVWTAAGFQAVGLDGGVVVGLNVPAAFADYGTPEGRSAQTGATEWSTPNLDASVNDTTETGLVGPGVASFGPGDPTSPQTSLVGTRDGTVRKSLPDSYICKYDQMSVIACYASGMSGPSLVAFDATSLAQLWQLPDAAGTRVAPELHAAYKGLLYTSADNGDVILNARTGADQVTNVPIAPDLVVPGFGLVDGTSPGDDSLVAYPATS